MSLFTEGLYGVDLNFLQVEADSTRCCFLHRIYDPAQRVVSVAINATSFTLKKEQQLDNQTVEPEDSYVVV